MAAPTHTYQGNPGYVFNLESGPVVLNPGDPVTLSAAEAEAGGDDFAPKTKKTAPADDTEGA